MRTLTMVVLLPVTMVGAALVGTLTMIEWLFDEWLNETA